MGMRFWRLLQPLLATAILFSLCFAVQAQSTSAWTIQNIGRGPNGTVASIVLDSHGFPRIAYTSAYDQYEDGSMTLLCDLQYASWNGSAWNIQDIGFQGHSAGSHVVLDSSDNPHFCYSYGTFDGKESLEYAKVTGVNWRSQRIDSACSDGYIALDSNDNPHVSYSKNKSLNYASLLSSNWDIQTIDTGALFTYYHSSIAMDSNNFPRILYGDAVETNGGAYISSGNVKYISWNGSKWSIQTILTNVTAFSNIALDSHDYPSFAYVDNSSLKYAYWDGSGWKFEDVFSHVTDECFLCLDKNNSPYISSYDRDEGLIYAKETGTHWNVQTVINSTANMAGPIALDTKGNPHIAYSSFDHGSIYYAEIKYATRLGSTTFQFSSQQVWITLLVIVVIVLLFSIVIFYRRKRATGSKQVI